MSDEIPEYAGHRLCADEFCHHRICREYWQKAKQANHDPVRAYGYNRADRRRLRRGRRP